ncbi:MAG: DUF3616 domain-containing protein [Cyanophyceae cyanobacterium]
MPEPFLLSRLLLHFEHKSEDLLSDISAAAFTPDGNLWVGSDELIGVERLSPIGPHTYGKHQQFALSNFIDLFNTEDEIDIEGMDYSHPYLWLTGSHSMKRDKPDGDDEEEDIEALTKVTTDLNRFILARIPVINGELVQSCSLSDEPKGKLRAACLQKSGERNLLIDAIAEDVHLQPFISGAIPSKDNGLDIEGLAIYDERVFLGLRGPVLRGWAILLEIEVVETEPGVLGLKAIGEDGELYRKHFVDLNGLGVRELCWRGEDLIILAGPTLDLEGSMRVFCLQNILDSSGNTLHGQDSDDLTVLFDLPFTFGTDHAEGLALYSCFEQEGLMVVYDSPDEKRLPAAKQIFADVFRLP